ncbi:MAG TPA: 2-succinylbenzoate--CoA ligase, partial [Minicystis sp.]|nr:2-succinylbenzoate--CoA ligase [Minicystis sp.]
GYDRGPGRAPDAARDASGWFDTGDLGELDARGRLHVHARRTDLVVTGGENVYPAEIEASLEALAGVRRALVFGVPDARWGQLVAAVVEAAADVDVAAVVASLDAALAPHKRPRLVARVDHIALGPSGKVERKGALERHAAGLSRR